MTKPFYNSSIYKKIVSVYFNSNDINIHKHFDCGFNAKNKIVVTEWIGFLFLNNVRDVLQGMILTKS